MLESRLTTLLASPDESNSLLKSFDNESINFENAKTFPIIQGIPIFLEGNDRNASTNFYEQFYQSQAEPWAYSERAAEVLRHEYVAEQVAQIYKEKGKKLIILDLGCSLGHITEKLHPYSEVLVGLDIAYTAIATAKKRCEEVIRGKENPYFFVVGSCLNLPFREGAFDVVVASDGIWGWFENDAEMSKKAVSEIYKVLKNNGIVVHTDYLHPNNFPKFVELTLSSPFQLIKEEFLYDRLWYRTESLFKALKSQSWVKNLLSNVGFAKGLKQIAKLLGAKYSKHISIIAKK
ncbi:MAG: class I SAM-dependent methyltransferase [Thermoflexibacter sp.]|jgi:SAM-dependent methyltransferase|nr:class I SAM-dependent methyltransferase [Thermoflexibacter sp.]